MNCLLIYDIPASPEGNRIRSKLADLCLDYGMNRVQYSTFAGDLLRTHQEELFDRARKKLGQKPGKVHLYCVGEREWGQRLLHERLAVASDPQKPMLNGDELAHFKIAVAGEVAAPAQVRRRRKTESA